MLFTRQIGGMLVVAAIVVPVELCTTNASAQVRGFGDGERSIESPSAQRPSDDAPRGPRRGRDSSGEGARRGFRSRGRSQARPAQPPAATAAASADDRLRNYVSNLVERYDKNGNKMLEADERETLRGKPAEADLNGDDVITINELVIHLSGDSSSSPSPSAFERQASAESASASRAAPADETRSPPRERSTAGRRRLGKRPDSGEESTTYRFTPPTERLPAGLPSWFTSRDENGDAQVAMSEYSSSWSDRKAAEFQRYDKNNDGFITPDECLEND